MKQQVKMSGLTLVSAFPRLSFVCFCVSLLLYSLLDFINILKYDDKMKLKGKFKVDQNIIKQTIKQTNTYINILYTTYNNNSFMT